MDNKANIGISITVWLDTKVNTSDDNRKAQEQLRMIIDRLKTFESRNECVKYIQSISSQERLLLIVGGRLGKELVPHIHSLPQVASIYVYCKNKNANEQWAVHFTKIKAVITQLDELISRIRIDQADSLLVDDKQTPNNSVVVSQSVPSASKFSLSVMCSYILSDILLRMKRNKTDKTELIARCKEYYNGNDSELTHIKEFQKKYSSNKAIWWYTRDSFLYKILKKALQTEDIDLIFLFQFFIRDLYQQLTVNQYQYPVRVYRGQRMTDDEFNSLRESVGHLHCIHTLLSTCIDRNVALSFLNAEDDSNDFQRVCFEIDADPEVVTTKPFADITKYSYFPGEGEVLFAIGSLFRITNIHQSDDQIWIIRMTLCGNKDPDVQCLCDEMTEKYGYYDGAAAFFSFNRVLREMKKFDAAEKYCHRLLQQFSSNDLSLCILYDELAKIASSKGNYDLNGEWHQKSIKIKKKIGFGSFGKYTGAVNYNIDHESSNIRDIIESNTTDVVTSSSTVDQHESENNIRFTDVAAESHDILLPIEGHEKMPLVTLEEAVKPLISILPDICRKAHTARLKCKTPADGLTSDQSAAIMLYTMEWKPRDQCLYFVLNEHLRKSDRRKLKPWFLYLKLILTGLSRLPSIEQTVYRGVKLDLSSKHQEGEEFFWWGFSSCTTTVNVLKSNQFLGNSGIRTFFLIECMNGKDIRRHSYYQKEAEILLLPATYIKVLSCFEIAPDLHAIQLKEIQPKFPYLEPVV